MRRQRMGTVIAFPFNVPMPYQIDPISGKLVQAPSAFKVPGQNAGPGGTNCGGGCGCQSCRPGQFPRLRKFLRGLGDDIGNGSGGDGGGGDGGGGGGLDFSGGGGGAIDPSTIPGYTGPGSPDFTPVPVDTTPTDTPPISPVDTGYTTNSDGSVTNNITGSTYFNDGSVILANGDYYGADGSVAYADGSYFNASTGQWTPAFNPQSQAGQQQAQPARQAAAASGGGSSGGGASPRGGGGGGSSQPSPLQQILCTLNPNQPGCQPRTTAPRAPARLATSSVSTFLSQNAGWLMAAGVLVFVLPQLLPPQGRR